MSSNLNSKNLNKFLTWFFSPKSNYVFISEPWNLKVFASIISTSYSNLVSADISEGFRKVNLLPYVSNHYNNKKNQYLKPVDDLKKYVQTHLKEHLIDFIIHGSISTLDYSKGWSDLDTLVIFKSESLKDSQKILKIRKIMIDGYRYLLNIDPLQHHGFILSTEKDLSGIGNLPLPLEVINYSKSLLGKKSISISCKKSSNLAVYHLQDIAKLLLVSSKTSFLDHHRLNGEALYENYKNENCMYQMKYFLSIIMTLPSYFLNAIGSPCYKLESFDLVRDKFIDEWEIIEKASLIRAMWPQKESYPYKSNFIPFWLRNILGSNYFSRASSLALKMNEVLKKNSK